MGERKPEVRVTQYTVSVLPEDSINRPGWEITVEYRGRDRWAVMHGGTCLSRDGVADMGIGAGMAVDYEPIPSERDEKWLARYRFTEQEALERAVEWAKVIRVNGKTAAEILEWEAQFDAPTNG